MSDDTIYGPFRVGTPFISGTKKWYPVIQDVIYFIPDPFSLFGKKELFPSGRTLEFFETKKEAADFVRKQNER